MNFKYYSVEKGQQILISLLKQHGIKRIVASPGATNITFVASLQHDSFFEIYSSVDERSAAYLACGMAEETGQPVVLTCTGATASRNYIPGLTEAFYRKLPILAVTATQNENRVGNMIPQMMDRSVQLKDMCVHSEHIAVPRDADDEWDANLRLNRALLALTHHGGGPVHVNLATNYTRDFSVKELPTARLIRRYLSSELLPKIPSGRVAIVVGTHAPFTPELTQTVDKFCEAYGAVVFCEHASNYNGHYRVYNAIVNGQETYSKETFRSDLLIHLGEVTGYGTSCVGDTKQVWRVSEDGELRDLYRKLTAVFEMTDEAFFQFYVAQAATSRKAEAEAWLAQCHKEYTRMQSRIPELPFSNPWIAQQTAHRLPADSYLHLGILNSLRAWDMFEVPLTVRRLGFVNTGGFGIDGCMSSMIGGSLAQPTKLHFLVIGDLAFFYDLNALGNRHIGRNVRILLVNNGKGTEFRNYNHFAANFGDAADEYMAAARHYGNQSPQLVRHYAEDLGFEYLSASTKEEYLQAVERWLTPEMTERPILLEAFTHSEDESAAIKAMNNLATDATGAAKRVLSKVLPKAAIDLAKKLK